MKDMQDAPGMPAEISSGGGVLAELGEFPDQSCEYARDSIHLVKIWGFFVELYFFFQAVALNPTLLGDVSQSTSLA